MACFRKAPSRRHGFKILLISLCVFLHPYQAHAGKKKEHKRRSELSIDLLREELTHVHDPDQPWQSQASESSAVQIGETRRLLEEISSALPSASHRNVSCLTYEERYRPYKSAAIGPGSVGDGNQQVPDSKYVVLLQLHKGLEELKEDLVLSARALAREVQSVGFHFYILYQNPTTMYGDATGEAWTYGQVQNLMPPDFRDVLIVYDAMEADQIHGSSAAQNLLVEGTKTPGPMAPHAGASIFMHRFQGYKFAFVLEHDVRLTGHWGHFLANALEAATKAEGKEAEALEGIEFIKDGSAGNFSEQADSRLPDLIAFEAVWESDKWNTSNTGHNHTAMEEMKAMIYGASRRLFDKMHKDAADNSDIYLESLLPYLHRQIPGGKRIVMKIDEEKESFHCCSEDGSALYKTFYESSGGRCSPTYLIHPVRNSEPFWPTYENQLQSVVFVEPTL